MKTITTLFLIFFMGIYGVQSQSICSEDIKIQNQEDLDNFNCAIVDGNLTLIITEELNLEPLSILTEVHKTLYIEFSPEISPDLSGLRNLKQARELKISSRGGSSGDTRIEIGSLQKLDSLLSLSVNEVTLVNSFPALKYLRHLSMYASYFQDITWLNNIDTIQTLVLNSTIAADHNEAFLSRIPEGGELTLNYSAFSKLDGLKGIHHLKRLDLTGAYGLSLDGLSELDSADYFIVSNVRTSEGCCGLSHYLRGDPQPLEFVFSNNSCSLEDILSGCYTCSGDIVLKSQEYIDNFTCKTVEGNLTLRTMGEEVDTSPLLVLDSIKGDLIIDVDQADHSGFSNLAFIGNRLYINNGINPDIKIFDFSSLASLNHVRQICLDSIFQKGKLVELTHKVESVHLNGIWGDKTTDWMPLVPSVDTIAIYNTPYFGNDYILKYLSDDGHFFAYNVGDQFAYFNSFDGFKGRTKIGGIHLQTAFVNTFRGLESLMEIDELELIAVESEDYSALCNLLSKGEITGNLIFESNAIELNDLMHLCDFPCEGDYYVYTQDDVDKFACKTLGGSLYLRSNEAIETTPFLQLDSIIGSLVFYGYRSYDQMEFPGFQNLKFIGESLNITGTFIDLGSFSNLSSLGRIDFKWAKTKGQIVSLMDTIDYVFIEDNLSIDKDELHLSNSNWLPNVPCIDTLRLYWVFDSTLYTGIIPKLGENSFLHVEYNGPKDILVGLKGKSKVGGLRLNNLYLESFDDLEDLESVGSLDIQGVNVIRDCCGLYNLLKNGSITGEFVFKNNSCTIEEILAGCAPEEVSSMSIYPNPSNSGKVTVDWKQDPSHKTHIQVLDNSGKMVYESWLDPGNGLGNVQLDISQYPSGVYLVRIITGDKVELKRLVKP
ncbi:T9SS type A sorting domain-containing protein [Fulvivirga sedimenti]|uniref:T9SS type A sorting domain-containing protein n=1 Tax=Fulvivirga sedimenti TaxID=2879465 RepID=A0A9X1HRF9_9BACT|nr:T9SS type A sorting domain-containing protein [Fulvivirga sedimenti]MCA6074639.1 T9SS type A sorting domain-containing protein [Fulvivirga sedimenti]MCA6075816.1 T9SS type A sorting domain-containing protein [Fulvivirga sedimenti]MCA6076944.1 T9SS type A sorting domain-containing protein [Fulvivirga sedimenti]